MALIAVVSALDPCLRLIASDTCRVILASLHVCVASSTSLADWAKTEQCLQHCFSAYGVKHVTISPELSGAQNTRGQSDTGCCSADMELMSKEGFGCDVGTTKKRVVGGDRV